MFVEREGQAFEEQEVEDLVDSKVRYNDIWYMVRWKEHTQSWAKWSAVLPGCEEPASAFHQRYPDKPKPAFDGLDEPATQYGLALILNPHIPTLQDNGFL